MRTQSYESIPDTKGLATFSRPRYSRFFIAVAACGLCVLSIPLLRVETSNTDSESLGVIGSLYKAHCILGLKRSGLDLLETDKYDQWFNDDSTMGLAQAGVFTGPEAMAEYVDFTKSTYFSLYEDLVSEKTRVVSATRNECVVQVAVENKVQVKPEYSKSGKSECIITTVGYKLDYKMGLLGSAFNIRRTKVFYPQQFLVELFNNLIGGEGVTDYICDTVLRDSCPEVYKLNNLTETTCKTMYDALPGVDGYGYLDDYAKGCRILHSAFAAINPKHCPHMSFKPIKDYHGDLWCQKSGGVKAEDLFTKDDLAFINEFSKNNGMDAATMYKSCD